MTSQSDDVKEEQQIAGWGRNTHLYAMDQIDWTTQSEELSWHTSNARITKKQALLTVVATGKHARDLAQIVEAYWSEVKSRTG